MIRILILFCFLIFSNKRITAQFNDSPWSLGINLGTLTTTNPTMLGSSPTGCCGLAFYTSEDVLTTGMFEFSLMKKIRPDMTVGIALGALQDGRLISGGIPGDFGPDVTFTDVKAVNTSLYLRLFHQLNIDISQRFSLFIENGISAHFSERRMKAEIINHRTYFFKYSFKPGLEYSLNETVTLSAKLSYHRTIGSHNYAGDYKPISYGLEVGGRFRMKE